MEKCPSRKPTRLLCYDYSQPGAYFVTVCVKEKRCILSAIVGGVDPDAPSVQLTAYGTVIMQNLNRMNAIYRDIHIDHFVIMPNHVHLLITISQDAQNGASGSTPPTNTLSRFIAAMKKFTEKECGAALWQRGFHDHVIRDDTDYRKHWQYIDENPKKWLMGKDAYYTGV